MAKEVAAERRSFMLHIHKEASVSADDGSGSQLELATATVKYLRLVVARCHYAGVDELLAVLRAEAKLVCAADPRQFVVHNMALRVMRLVREEFARLMSGADDTPADPYDALHKLWDCEEAGGRSAVDKRQLKEAVIGTLNEYLAEIENSEENQSSQGAEHVHSGDTVLTYGASRSVESFLRAAARKQAQFTVVAATCSPHNTGAAAGERLRSSAPAGGGRSPRVLCVDDCSVADIMPTVSKVLLGAHAVLADGGFIGQAGVYALCLAAKRYSVPVIVCCAVYKLTPRFLSDGDQDAFNKLLSPRDVLPLAQGDLVRGVRVVNAAYDYVPPELVTLYIGQTSANAPSYVYRLLSEFYHPDDTGHIAHSPARCSD